jgi:hypothetical protein
MANANKVLLDSLVAQRSDGALVVGRGVPSTWLGAGRTTAVTNFPTTDGKRIGVRIVGGTKSVTLTVTGARPSGDILFQLPAFVGNLASASAGRISATSGTVELGSGVRSVTVELRHAVAG